MDINQNFFLYNEISFIVNTNNYTISFDDTFPSKCIIILIQTINNNKNYYSHTYSLSQLNIIYNKNIKKYQNISEIINNIKQDISDNKNKIDIKQKNYILTLSIFSKNKLKYYFELKKVEYKDIIIQNLFSIINKQQSQITNLTNELTLIKNDIKILKEEKLLNNKEKLEKEEKIQNHLNYIQKNFNFSPNLTYKETIITTGFQEAFELFDIYYSFNNNKELRLITPNKNNIDIDIIRIKDKNLITTLKGHLYPISSIRHFFNKNDCKDYLISSEFENYLVKLWNLSEFKLVYSILTQYHSNIFSCLYIDNLNYFIISTGHNDINTDYTHVYKFDDGSLIKKIFDTNTHSTYYILYYFYENNHYLIECGCGKIYIYNILTNELFKELKKEKNESDHYSACIINNNLCVSSDNGYIDIWDLNNGNLIKSINCKKSNFYGIISWNEKFLIVADSANYSFCIIDIKIGKKISNIGGIHQGGVICLKKIIHPIFGESLLSNDDEGDIKLWIINNILINYFSN